MGCVDLKIPNMSSLQIVRIREVVKNYMVAF